MYKPARSLRKPTTLLNAFDSRMEQLEMIYIPELRVFFLKAGLLLVTFQHFKQWLMYMTVNLSAVNCKCSV